MRRSGEQQLSFRDGATSGIAGVGAATSRFDRGQQGHYDAGAAASSDARERSCCHPHRERSHVMARGEALLAQRLVGTGISSCMC